VVYATDEPHPSQLDLENYRKSGPDGAINVSVKTEEGLPEVRKIHSNFHILTFISNKAIELAKQ